MLLSCIGSELLAAWGYMVVIDRRRLRRGVRFVASNHCADTVAARTEAHAVRVEHPLLRAAAAGPDAAARLAQVVSSDFPGKL